MGRMMMILILGGGILYVWAAFATCRTYLPFPTLAFSMETAHFSYGQRENFEYVWNMLRDTEMRKEQKSVSINWDVYESNWLQNRILL
jgi:hypothetical protein